MASWAHTPNRRRNFEPRPFARRGPYRKRSAHEDGLTCPRCNALCPWTSIVCAVCGARLV